MLEPARAAMEGDIGVDGEVDIDISMTATWVIDTVQFERTPALMNEGISPNFAFLDVQGLAFLIWAEGLSTKFEARFHLTQNSQNTNFYYFRYGPGSQMFTVPKRVFLPTWNYELRVGGAKNSLGLQNSYQHRHLTSRSNQFNWVHEYCSMKIKEPKPI